MILASRPNRLIAQVLDTIIALVPFIALVFLAEMAPGWIARRIENLWLPALLVCLGYLFLADSLPGGQSYGKRLLGMAVVDERTGAPCSPWQSFVRNAMLSVLGIFDWAFIFGERRQRLGDMVARTIVVEAATVGVGMRYDDQESPRVAYGPHGR